MTPSIDLPLSPRPATVGFRPRSLGVVFGSGRYQRSIEIRPASLPLHARKALVGQVGLLRVLDDEKLSYGALVGGCLRQPEGADHALWADRKSSAPRRSGLRPGCNTRSPSGKRGSAHHSLRWLVACYPILRMESPEHSPWRTPRDDLDDSSYQGTVLDFSISHPYEVALVGEPGEADTQTLINTVYAAYLPNKLITGCITDDEEDAGLIPLLAVAPHALWQGDC